MTIELLVENMGRVNYPTPHEERKGFQGSIVLGRANLRGWQQVSLDFKEPFLNAVSISSDWKFHTIKNAYPALYRGRFKVDDPQDTFVDMVGWTKGIVILNGFNLGRYWFIGPTRTMYVPKPLLRRGLNEIIVFELEKSSTSVKFVDAPVLDEMLW